MNRVKNSLTSMMAALLEAAALGGCPSRNAVPCSEVLGVEGYNTPEEFDSHSRVAFAEKILEEKLGAALPDDCVGQICSSEFLPINPERTPYSIKISDSMISGKIEVEYLMDKYSGSLNNDRILIGNSIARGNSDFFVVRSVEDFFQQGCSFRSATLLAGKDNLLYEVVVPVENFSPECFVKPLSLIHI